MATCSTHDDGRRRKSWSGERHEKRKKRKEASDDSKSKRSRVHPSGSTTSSAAGKKVRSISGLVKLVIAGEVKVPQSLRHYVEDRGQLVDQVFTILSESDVRGMLPDILKGLKMRQVRRLCLDQLKSMSTQNIIDTIDYQNAVKSLNIDAAMYELLGSGTASGDAELAASNEARSSSESASNEWSKGGRQDGMDGEERVDVGRSWEGSKMDAKLCENVGERKMSVSQLSIEEEDDREGAQEGICVSDVSEEDNDVDGSPTQTMECDTTTTELSQTSCKSGEMEREREDSVRRGGGMKGHHVEDNEVVCRRLEAHRGVDSESSSSLSDLEDCWLGDFPDELSEWGRLQEVEFRRRALEAELRRRGEGEEGGVSKGRWREGEEEGRRGDRVANQATSERVDKSEAIELQLRQRALQSLLARKKERKL